MKSAQEQKQIEKNNKEIEDAVAVAQMMEHPGYKIFIKKLKEVENKFRHQDILGIKDDALSDQKGIVLGIIQVQDLFKEIKNLAERPRRDPMTGEPEKMREKEK